MSHFPSLRYRSIEALLVRGSPWVDDLWAKAPSRRLKIEFSDGPDVSIEDLYKAFRPFGLILDIRAPPSQPTDAPHFILVDFVTKRDAANARACLHGQEFTQENKKSTRIGIMYENMAPGATSWAWLTSHPRIAIPLLLVLIAGLSYAVFDPLRVANVENEITGGFSLRKSYGRLLAWYDSKWRRVRASIASSIGTTAKGKKTNQVNLISWDERVQDLLKLSATVQSVPETPILISGPVGSGKAELVSEATQEKPYRLRIDCSAIVSESGYASVGALAEQVNYYPSFVSLASFSNLIDGLLSAATGAKVGQTANDSIPGLSSSVESFLRKILDTVSVALSDIVALEEKKRDRDAETGSDIATVNYPVIVIDSFLSLNNAQAQTFYKVIMEVCAVT